MIINTKNLTLDEININHSSDCSIVEKIQVNDKMLLGLIIQFLSRKFNQIIK